MLSCLWLARCATTQSQRAEESPEVQRQVEEIRRTSWQQMMSEGVAAAQTGDFTRAEQYFAAALHRGGPPEEILPPLLRVCVSAHRYRAAVEYSRPYLLMHEEAWALRFLIASIHIGLNEPLTASRHLELVLRHNPNHAEAEFLLGTLFRDDLRDPGRADEHFRRYLALAPDGPHADAARSGLMRRVDEAARESTLVESAGGSPVLVSVSADAGVSSAMDSGRSADATSDAARRR